MHDAFRTSVNRLWQYFIRLPAQSRNTFGGKWLGVYAAALRVLACNQGARVVTCDKPAI